MPTPQQHEMAVQEWQAGADRVCGLVHDVVATRGDLEVVVPAAPGWTARELLSHVVGLAADVLAGDEPADHHPAWTQAQVDARSARTPDELLAEWRDQVPAMRTYLREVDVRPLNDLMIHEQDLRGALGRPGARDTAGLRHVRDTLAGRLAGRIATDVAPLALESDDGWVWRSHAGEPGALLRATSFDLTRAVTTRRTAEQLRSWVVSGDVAPYLAAFAVLGELPEHPLPE